MLICELFCFFEHENFTILAGIHCCAVAVFWVFDYFEIFGEERFFLDVYYFELYFFFLEKVEVAVYVTATASKRKDKVECNDFDALFF